LCFHANEGKTKTSYLAFFAGFFARLSTTLSHFFPQPAIKNKHYVLRLILLDKNLSDDIEKKRLILKKLLKGK